MWILNFIPDFVIHLAVLAGAAALIVTTFFGSIIPAMYKLPVQIAGIIVLAGSLWIEGANYNQGVWEAQVKELEEKVRISEEKSAVVNEVVKTKIVNKVKVVKEREVVVQELIKEVEKVINAKCEVPKEAIDILNEAAKDPAEAVK
jgi:hypothetical protein